MCLSLSSFSVADWVGVSFTVCATVSWVLGCLLLFVFFFGRCFFSTFFGAYLCQLFLSLLVCILVYNLYFFNVLYFFFLLRRHVFLKNSFFLQWKRYGASLLLSLLPWLHLTAQSYLPFLSNHFQLIVRTSQGRNPTECGSVLTFTAATSHSGLFSGLFWSW